MLPGHIKRELFGGAITAETPSYLIDASDLRQVPDTQEVFMYPDNEDSIVVEILERVQPPEPEEAIKFHFDSLAYDNDAEAQNILNIDTFPNNRGDETPAAIVLHGTQRVRKFNRVRPDEVKILMALYRVESRNIDLVLTFNIPLKSVDGSQVSEAQGERAIKDFDTFARSLHIVDFGLFA